MDINVVVLTGEVISVRESNGMYVHELEIERPSGECDIIEVLSEDKADGFIRINGEARSRQSRGLKPYVFADRIEPCEEQFENECILEGFICQVPYYKKLRTREVTAFMIALEGKRMYYIPIVCWGRVARKVANFEKGRKVVIKGRCQTRTYNKNGCIKEAKEVSAYEIM